MKLTYNISTAGYDAVIELHASFWRQHHTNYNPSDIMLVDIWEQIMLDGNMLDKEDEALYLSLSSEET